MSDAQPGIQRIRRRDTFVYRRASGSPVRDVATLDRIRRLAIPPAYERVWICTRPDGHLQATGRDARGRKQYRYHPAFRAQREAVKFDRLMAFGQGLPALRRRVAEDLRRVDPDGLPTREAVVATIVHLLDTTFVRIGNDVYARENRSFGLTTLRGRHVDVRGTVLRLNFRGKSGRLHEVRLDDARVARIVRRCQQLPGQELFQYVGADGVPRAIGSADVNDYLERATRERFTAKDFRTWHGSVCALELLRSGRIEPGRGRVASVAAGVAACLGNTPAVCRKSYIHPAVLALAEQPSPIEPSTSGARPRRGLRAAEGRLLALLQSRPARA